MDIPKLQKGTDSKFEMQRIEQAKRIIEPFMLRRLKADVLKSLPVKTVVINSIVMTDHQYTRYNTLRNEIKEASKDKVTPDNDHMMWVTMLRKLTNHPLLLRYHFEVCNYIKYIIFSLLMFIFIYNIRMKNYTKWLNY